MQSYTYRIGHTDFVIMGTTPNPGPGDTWEEGRTLRTVLPFQATPRSCPQTAHTPSPAMNTTSDVAHTEAVSTRVPRRRNMRADLGQPLDPSTKLKDEGWTRWRSGQGGFCGRPCRAAVLTPGINSMGSMWFPPGTLGADSMKCWLPGSVSLPDGRSPMW